MSFLKVKRKCEEDARELLVLASKKSKLQNICNDAPIFELRSAAVDEKDINDVIHKTIQNRDIKKREFDIEKIRRQMRAENSKRTKNNRFKVLSVLRKLDIQLEEPSVPVIIDVIDDGEKNENQNGYVYDLYYSSTNVDVSDPNFANNYCLHEVDNQWDYEQETDDEEAAEDDDDSNDENNWRNDYPDEEEQSIESGGDVDEDLGERMTRTHLFSNSDYSLSSDELDEDIGVNLYERKSRDEYFDYYDEIASDVSDSTWITEDSVYLLQLFKLNFRCKYLLM